MFNHRKLNDKSNSILNTRSRHCPGLFLDVLLGRAYRHALVAEGAVDVWPRPSYPMPHRVADHLDRDPTGRSLRCVHLLLQGAPMTASK